MKAKRIYSILLLSILLFCIIKNSLLFAFYELDTSAFVTLFCENKSRPELNCNGHCLLAKMSKEQDKKEGAGVLSSLQEEIFFYYLELENPDITVSITAIHINHLPYLNKDYSFLFLSQNDKPPEILS